jgi:hypothetical protein
MARLRKYLEGTSASRTVTFLDEDGASALPTTLRYRIDCLTSKREVRDWTTLTPAVSVVIPITPDDNEIQDSRNPTERKQMVVQSNHGTDEQVVGEYEWLVTNLQGVT